MKLDTKLDREDVRQIGKFIYPNMLLIIGAAWCEVTGHPGAVLVGFSIGLLTSIIFKYLDLGYEKKRKGYEKKRKALFPPSGSTWYDEWFIENYPEWVVEGRPLYKEYDQYLKNRNRYYGEGKDKNE